MRIQIHARTSNKVAAGKIGCLVYFSPLRRLVFLIDSHPNWLLLHGNGYDTNTHLYDKTAQAENETSLYDIFHLLTIGDLIVFELFHKSRNMSRLLLHTSFHFDREEHGPFVCFFWSPHR